MILSLGLGRRGVDASIVVVDEIWGDIHPASDWSSSENFLLHGVFSVRWSVFRGVPLSEVRSDWCADLLETWAPLAVHAILDWAAAGCSRIRGSVNLASELNYIVKMGELVNSIQGATLA